MSVPGLNAAIVRFTTSGDASRDAFRQSATALAQIVRKERDEIVARMDRRWAWLDAHEGHPQFAEREDALIQDIHEYERMEDALNLAASVLYGSAA